MWDVRVCYCCCPSLYGAAHAHSIQHLGPLPLKFLKRHEQYRPAHSMCATITSLQRCQGQYRQGEQDYGNVRSFRLAGRCARIQLSLAPCRIEPDSLDLLILPETAFTGEDRGTRRVATRSTDAAAGYCFESREDVEPFLEDSTAGPTYHWASAKAAALRCYVLVGFPERAPDDTAYNSMLVVSPSGIVTVYRKHFLYPPADPKWAAEGPGFQTIDLPYLPSHAKHSPTSSTTFRVCLSICMDLSPKEFLAPFDAYELSNFALEHKADVLVCCMAWLDAEPPTLQTEEELRMSDAATPVKTFSEVRSTIGYWAARCAPLIGTGTLFVACNRIGREGGEALLFGGFSSGPSSTC